MRANNLVLSIANYCGYVVASTEYVDPLALLGKCISNRKIDLALMLLEYMVTENALLHVPPFVPPQALTVEGLCLIPPATLKVIGVEPPPHADVSETIHYVEKGKDGEEKKIYKVRLPVYFVLCIRYKTYVGTEGRRCLMFYRSRFESTRWRWTLLDDTIEQLLANTCDEKMLWNTMSPAVIAPHHENLQALKDLGVIEEEPYIEDEFGTKKQEDEG